MKSIEERFWPKVARGAADECWPWIAATDPKGYGRIGAGGGRGCRTLFAHRVAYELLVGPIPPSLELDHRCRHPACVNPAHLEPVTHRENMIRGRNANAEKASCVRGHVGCFVQRGERPHRFCLRCDRERPRRARST